jgi:hypothetical protein
MVAMAKLNCFDVYGFAPDSRMPVDMIAFNGGGISLRGGYSIAKFLPKAAVEHRSHNWNFHRAVRFAEGIERMSVGVSFSRGATALSHMPAYTDYFTDVFLHSPAFEQPEVNPGCRYHIFITQGDKTPVSKDAFRLFEWVADHGGTVSLVTLGFVEYESPSLFELWMERKRHIFHNIVPTLKACNVTRRFYSPEELEA